MAGWIKCSTDPPQHHSADLNMSSWTIFWNLFWISSFNVTLSDHLTPSCCIQILRCIQPLCSQWLSILSLLLQRHSLVICSISNERESARTAGAKVLTADAADVSTPCLDLIIGAAGAFRKKHCVENDSKYSRLDWHETLCSLPKSHHAWKFFCGTERGITIPQMALRIWLITSWPSITILFKVACQEQK